MSEPTQVVSSEHIQDLMIMSILVRIYFSEFQTNRSFEGMTPNEHVQKTLELDRSFDRANSSVSPSLALHVSKIFLSILQNAHPDYCEVLTVSSSGMSMKPDYYCNFYSGILNDGGIKC